MCLAKSSRNKHKLNLNIRIASVKSYYELFGKEILGNLWLLVYFWWFCLEEIEVT